MTQDRMPDDTADPAATAPIRTGEALADPASAPVEPLILPAKIRLSDMLQAIANDSSRDRISIADLLASMDNRAMGALLLIFALPNVLPTLPGTSGILGLPLVYLTSQMMLGRLPWLPRFIANRSLARRDFAAFVERAEPWLARTERLLKPRLSLLVQDQSERLIGALTLLLSVVLLLPIPLGNMLPALAISLLALGLMERDGVWILAGTATATVALAVVSAVLYALAKSLLFVLAGAFR